MEKITNELPSDTKDRVYKNIAYECWLEDLKSMQQYPTPFPFHLCLWKFVNPAYRTRD